MRCTFWGGALWALLDAAVVIPLILLVLSFDPPNLNVTTGAFVACMHYARLWHTRGRAPRGAGFY
jgi:hypothetical protein